MTKRDHLGWAATLSVRTYGVRIGVRSNSPACLDRIQRHLPHKSRIVDSGVVDRIYSIIVGDQAARPKVRRISALYGDSVQLARSYSLDEVFDRFESDLRLFVAELARDRTFVHAGVVSWKGKAIVIPARSFSGKSTLVAELVRAGATYYSDEYAVFDSQGRVHPFLKELEIRSSGDWKQTKVAVDQLGGRVGKRAIPVGVIVVTQFKHGTRWRPQILSPGKAMLALLSNTVSARRHPEKAMTTLQNVVARAEALHGPRGEAAEIAQSLLARMEKST